MQLDVTSREVVLRAAIVTPTRLAAAALLDAIDVMSGKVESHAVTAPTFEGCQVTRFDADRKPGVD